MPIPGDLMLFGALWHCISAQAARSDGHPAAALVIAVATGPGRCLYQSRIWRSRRHRTEMQQATPRPVEDYDVAARGIYNPDVPRPSIGLQGSGRGCCLQGYSGGNLRVK